MARSRQGLALACFALLVAAASAAQFRVGGQKGWSVPEAGFEPYNTWAARLRFQIGDQLLFVYPKGTDSVLLVDPAAYNACNTSSYAARFDDGATVFTLNSSGPFFFISGNEASCRANEKLIVVVLADRTGARTPPPAPAPALPTPSPSAPPTPSPTASPPAGAAPLPSPASPPPSPAASAPATAPMTAPSSSPPAPGAMTPSPSTTPGGAAQPPSANAPGGADGSNATTPPPPSPSAAAPAVAGVVGALGAFIGYAVLAA